MTTPTHTTATPAVPLSSQQVEQVIDQLRARQTGSALAEQRHRFLDNDRDQDYTREAPTGGGH
ncbi:hypothetical protein [Streptomyces hygroscopicus]|uniref:hypothetical protein n=1 Tax=Streptomyces hygroscopicus TaxID=1912 RepID=UPI000785B0D9|nr:hypothetical protein [Streptomyces hygroscopicus]